MGEFLQIKDFLLTPLGLFLSISLAFFQIIRLKLVSFVIYLFSKTFSTPPFRPSLSKFLGIIPYFTAKTKKELFVQGAQFDQEVTQLFGPYLSLSEAHWSQLERKVSTYPILQLHLRFRLAQILLNDQVSRHLYRHDSEKIRAFTTQNQSRLTWTAEEIRYLSLKELALLTLAARHLCRQFSQTEKNSANHQQLSDLLQQYLQWLAIRIQYSEKIQDEPANQIQFAKAVHSQNIAHHRLYRYIPPDYQVWAQPKALSFRTDDLATTRAWLTDFLKESETAQYLREKWSQFSKSDSPPNSPNTYPLTIDIWILVSGGIDSMTMARTALALLYTQTLPHVNFHFLHINWRKRNEATQEAKALRTFFEHFRASDDQAGDSQAGLNLSFRLEIVESPIPPDDPDWDRKTTNFRFQLLRELAGSNPELTFFCLGHVAPDLLENLISNASLEGSSMGKQTALDLFGMQEVSKMNGVWVYRPLLLHHKPDDHGQTTPYLRDNATNLDIKRRIIRRLVTNFEFDISRLRTVYHDFQDLRSKYEQLPLHQQPAPKTLAQRPGRPALKIPPDQQYWWFRLEPDWTYLEWKVVLANVLNRLQYPGVKQKAIQFLRNRYLTARTADQQQSFPFYQDMSAPFIHQEDQHWGFLVTGSHLGIPVIN